jgi:polyphosphate kinase 2 (PPK2 family)
MGRLDEIDLSLHLSREEEAERLEAGHHKLLALRLALGGKLGEGALGPPVCVLFEGWDASGKGGAIKRLVDRLHVSDAEQLDRFQAREKNPLKRWKLTGEDWRNREKRADYERAVEDMLAHADHDQAPWQLVEADSKRYARVKVLETVIAEIEHGMRERGFVPPPELDAILERS